MPIIEIESEWRETGTPCPACGWMTYTDGKHRAAQCSNPDCLKILVEEVDIIDRLNGEHFVDAIDDAIAEIEKLRARQEATVKLMTDLVNGAAMLQKQLEKSLAGQEREIKDLKERLAQPYQAREEALG